MGRVRARFPVPVALLGAVVHSRLPRDADRNCASRPCTVTREERRLARGDDEMERGTRCLSGLFDSCRTDAPYFSDHA
jgi:hypothetical protein